MMISRTVISVLALGLTACGSEPAPQPPPTQQEAAPQEAAPQEAAPQAPAQEETATEQPAAADAGAITESNWKGHPDIVEVRELVAQIQSAMGGGGWTTDRQKFSDGCAEQGIYEVTLNSQQGSDYVFTEVGGMGDLSRTTTHYYDDSGQARFVMSEYVHGSAESKMVSRLYLADDGAVLFAPQPEQVSEKGGPSDDMSITDLLLAKSSDARARHTKVVQDCTQ